MSSQISSDTMTKASNGTGKGKAMATPIKTRATSAEEVWKPTHLTDLYEVSNLGRVRRTDSKKVRSNSTNRHGYQLLTLPVGGKDFTNLVGRLVLGAFARAPIDGDVAHHIDRNRANDVIENLKWTTISEASAGRSYPSTIASRPVVATSVNGGEDMFFMSALEASAFFETSRDSIYNSMRFERSLKEYRFGYDKSNDPTGEVKKIRGSTSHLVSSDGRVKMSRGRWTQGYRHTVKLQTGDRCYRRVDMTLIVDGKSIRAREYVHVLVAEAFIGERPQGYQVDHIDGFEGNNDLSNLRYVSPSDNNRNAYARGRRQAPGEKPVLLIKQDGTFTRFKSSSEGARQMGVNVATVSINCSSARRNKDGDYWAHDKPVVKLGGDEFESMSRASKDTGESILSILLSCRNIDDESWACLE